MAFGGAQWPSFEALQQRMNISSPAQIGLLVAEVPVTYLAFDLLCLDGRPLLDAPYTERRALLDELGLNGPHWQTPPSFTDAAGADVLAVVEAAWPGRRGGQAAGLPLRAGQAVAGLAQDQEPCGGRRPWSAAGSRARATGPGRSARC